MTVPRADSHGVVFVKCSHFHLYTHQRTELSTFYELLNRCTARPVSMAVVLFSVRQGIQISITKCNLQLFHYLWCKKTLKSWIPGCSLPTACGLQIPIKECRQNNPQSVKLVLTWDINCSLQIPEKIYLAVLLLLARK